MNFTNNEEIFEDGIPERSGGVLVAKERTGRGYFHLIPVFLSLWMLGAHFLRAGQLLLALISVLASLALFIRRQWIARIVQLALIAGTMEWIRTAVILVLERQSMGLPWLRLAFIMGLVILLAVCSIFVLKSKSLQKSYKWK